MLSTKISRSADLYLQSCTANSVLIAGEGPIFPVLLIALAIPIVGFGISTWIISDINSVLPSDSLLSFQVICDLEEARADEDLRAACEEFDNILLLRSSSTYAGLLGIAIPSLIWLGSLLAGSHRSRLAHIISVPDARRSLASIGFGHYARCDSHLWGIHW